LIFPTHQYEWFFCVPTCTNSKLKSPTLPAKPTQWPQNCIFCDTNLKFSQYQGEPMPHQPNDLPTSPTLRKAWQDLHEAAPKGILNSRKMTRRQRERLTTAGYLEPIMRGWYRLKSPGDTEPSESPILDFLPIYLDDRLGSRWCLSAESSLVIRMAPQSDPRRMVVMAEIGSTTVHTFDSGLRLTIYQDDQQLPTRMEILNGFRVMPVDTILGRMTNSQWTRQLHLVDQILSSTRNFETMVWQWLSEERYQAVTRLGARLGELGLTQGYAFVKQCLIEEGLVLPEVKSAETVQDIVAPEPTSTPPQTNNTNDLKAVWQIWDQQMQKNHHSASKSDINLLTSASGSKEQQSRKTSRIFFT